MLFFFFCFFCFCGNVASVSLLRTLSHDFRKIFYAYLPPFYVMLSVEVQFRPYFSMHDFKSWNQTMFYIIFNSSFQMWVSICCDSFKIELNHTVSFYFQCLQYFPWISTWVLRWFPFVSGNYHRTFFFLFSSSSSSSINRKPEMQQ